MFFSLNSNPICKGKIFFEIYKNIPIFWLNLNNNICNELNEKI